MRDINMFLLGYINERQWIDALKSVQKEAEREVIISTIKKVEKYYRCEVVTKEKYRQQYRLD
jgi:hypothetical protein